MFLVTVFFQRPELEYSMVQDLSYTSTNNPTYLVYLAAQVMNNDMSLLSTNVTVRELITLGGDIHHIFPKEYLKENGFEKNKDNQEANYVYLDRPVNISIGKKSPKDYLTELRIRQACVLLRESDLSITAIANSVGFDNSLYFSKTMCNYFLNKLDFLPNNKNALRVQIHESMPKPTLLYHQNLREYMGVYRKLK